MPRKNFAERLEESEDLPQIFELVKDSVRWVLKTDRSGLMLGLADLGNFSNGFLGAFHPVGSNIIVMNRTPLERIKETNKSLFKPYAFHVLLHEYLHTLGVLEEERVSFLVYAVSRECFGDDHLVTKIAKDITKFVPDMIYPWVEWKPKDLDIMLVEGFDRSSYPYIG